MIKTIYSILSKAFAPQGWWPLGGKYHVKIKDDKDRFEIILGALLATNISWSNADKALANLRKADLISTEKIKAVNINKLKQLIRPAGYYNQKAERLKIIAKFLSENKIGDLKQLNIAELRQTLLAIKGIGPETADSIILYAFEKPIFVIDAYTKRIFSRVGVLAENKSYDEFQNLFHKSLKQNAKLFNEYHALIVELAKQHCRKQPLCKSCLVESVCKKAI